MCLYVRIENKSVTSSALQIIINLFVYEQGRGVVVVNEWDLEEGVGADLFY